MAELILRSQSGAAQSAEALVAMAFNRLVGRDADAPLDVSTFEQAGERFGQLTDEQKYAFNEALVRLWLAGIPQPPTTPVALPPVETPSFVSINGPMVLDVGVVAGVDHQGAPGALRIERVTVSPGTTGFNSPRVLASLGAQTFFVAIGGEAERAVAERLITHERSGIGHFLPGLSRANVFVHVPDPAAPDRQLREVILRTPRQPLTEALGTELLAFVEERLPHAYTNRQVVLLGGQVFHKAPPTLTRNVIALVKAKGYEVLADFRPDMTYADIVPAFEAASDIVKPNLEEFATLCQVPVEELRSPSSECALSVH